jgi:hypothetical protein
MKDKPLVESLLDTDFYKSLMLQLIWRLHPEVPTEPRADNRTRLIRLSHQIDLSMNCASSSTMFARWPCRRTNRPGWASSASTTCA